MQYTSKKSWCDMIESHRNCLMVIILLSFLLQAQQVIEEGIKVVGKKEFLFQGLMWDLLKGNSRNSISLSFMWYFLSKWSRVEQNIPYSSEILKFSSQAYNWDLSLKLIFKVISVEIPKIYFYNSFRKIPWNRLVYHEMCFWSWIFWGTRQNGCSAAIFFVCGWNFLETTVNALLVPALK